MKFVSLYIALLTCLTSFGQWNYFSSISNGYSGNNGDIIQSSDGNYVYCAEFDSPSFTERDILIEKIDDSGNLIWSKTYGINDLDRGFQLFETTDQGFMVFGYTVQDSPYQTFAWFLKLNSSGDTLWTKKYNSYSDGYQFANIEPIGNDQFAGAFGSSDSLFFSRYNANADLVAYNASFIDSLSTIDDIKCTPTGDFILCGSTRFFIDPSTSERDFLFVKMDQNGNLIWRSIIAYENVDDFAHGAAVGSDGNYVFAGSSRDTTTLQRYAIAIKVDASTGDTLWTKRVGTWHESSGADIVSDGSNGFVITGYVQDITSGDYRPYLTHIDQNGNINWQQIYSDGSANGSGYEVKKTSSGYVIFGLGLDPNGSEAHWIINTNASGVAATTTLELNHSKELLKIVDLFGRETSFKANQVQIYVYTDGTAEKKLVIE